jgi:hypothetical protein
MTKDDMRHVIFTACKLVEYGFSPELAYKMIRSIEDLNRTITRRMEAENDGDLYRNNIGAFHDRVDKLIRREIKLSDDIGKMTHGTGVYLTRTGIHYAIADRKNSANIIF